MQEDALFGAASNYFRDQPGRIGTALGLKKYLQDNIRYIMRPVPSFVDYDGLLVDAIMALVLKNRITRLHSGKYQLNPDPFLPDFDMEQAVCSRFLCDQKAKYACADCTHRFIFCSKECAQPHKH